MSAARLAEPYTLGLDQAMALAPRRARETRRAHARRSILEQNARELSASRFTYPKADGDFLRMPTAADLRELDRLQRRYRVDAWGNRSALPARASQILGRRRSALTGARRRPGARRSPRRAPPGDPDRDGPGEPAADDVDPAAGEKPAWLPCARALAHAEMLIDAAIVEGDEHALVRLLVHADMISDRLSQAVYEIENFSPGEIARRRELEQAA